MSTAGDMFSSATGFLKDAASIFVGFQQDKIKAKEADNVRAQLDVQKFEAQKNAELAQMEMANTAIFRGGIVKVLMMVGAGIAFAFVGYGVVKIVKAMRG